ncbi:MAG TPA: ParA family protein [Verrucomicrobiota bacterium]|jgi:cellulose biosynthesis protein BcsQ|nr:ParA family protein [Verrucomicrobiota bacterium]OQC63395.1 MAG: Chromosome partitioning protein ParA [Verrucomicrobia bacterium ADurb.Bin006]HNU99047.1 ParA family protein [Verrucomicrobiota bacterium]HOA62468.1 ParA family protein [Verrucomicrobiota bacterium]HOF49741.1 ParA family protein [Verrucomicrobiota bacterium]
MKTIAFFNNKGGVGKTTLVYHLAWMYADLGVSVVAADLDPQANLSAMFLSEERLEELWPDGDHPKSILGTISPILRGLGDIAEPHVEKINRDLGLLVGDLGLSRFEAKLSSAWPDCMNHDEAGFRTESAFHRAILKAAEAREAELVLIDVGPNLGAINRAAIIAANYVVFPLAPDLFSLQGLRNLGPTLQDWRNEWRDRLGRPPADRNLLLPSADIKPAGYVVMQHAVRADRPVKAYDKWMQRIPAVYHQEVLHDRGTSARSTAEDPECLATLKHFRSLMPMAQDALKPMFHLKAADGALGGHIYAVQECHADFKKLAVAIATKCGVSIP